MSSNLPIACNMNVFTAEEREEHLAATRDLFSGVERIEAVEDGFAFLIPNRIDLGALSQFITAERRCCPFLEFSLMIAPEAEPIRLILTGPTGTQEFLREEFSEAFDENKI